MARVTLITGGARSGKSRHALELASGADRRVFVATAEAFDDDMERRIQRHREERGGAFETVEEPHDPARVIRSLDPVPDVIVLDCVTVWLGNLMHDMGLNVETIPEVETLVTVLEQPPCDVIVVTNEVGDGIVPATGLARRFRDMAGTVNRRLAGVADRVLLMVCGIPVDVKGGAR
jgi:adenosylcobinamide kinase/adenosylcobinamide-phosphate guanylyltransferase